jgi:hypothetical protein
MAARDRLDHARHDAAAERTSTLAGEYGSVLQYQRKNGARRRGRTADTAIFSRMLYQLSYPGIVRSGSDEGPIVRSEGRV